MYLSHLRVNHVLLIITCAGKKTTKQNQGNYFFFRKRTTKISNIFVCLVYGIDILQKRVISPSILKFSKNINFFLAKHKS